MSKKSKNDFFNTCHIFVPVWIFILIQSGHFLFQSEKNKNNWIVIVRTDMTNNTRKMTHLYVSSKFQIPHMIKIKIT